MALSAGVQRPAISDPTWCSAPISDNVVVYQGALIMMDTAGRVRPAAASVSGTYCVGVAQPRDLDLDRYDNTIVGHTAGAITVRYKEGAFGFLNDGTNPILATTQPGTVVYAVDDQTVSLSSSSGTRPVAGRLRGYDTSSIGGPVIVECSKFIGSQAYNERIDQQVSQIAPEICPVILSTLVSLTPVFRFTPQYPGVIQAFNLMTMQSPTTTSKAANFQPYISGVAVSGGIITTTSTNLASTNGTITAGTTITGSNTFAAGQEITIVPTGVTQYVEGQVLLEIYLGPSQP